MSDATITAYVPEPVALKLIERCGWRIESCKGGSSYTAPGRPSRSEGGSFRDGDYVWSLQDALEQSIASCADEPAREPATAPGAIIDQGIILVDGRTASGIHVAVTKGPRYDDGNYADVTICVDGVLVRRIDNAMRARDGGTTVYDVTVPGVGQERITFPNSASNPDDRTPRLNDEPILLATHDHADTYSVPCPVCDAGATVPCLPSTNAKLYTDERGRRVHSARTLKARRATRVSAR